MLRSLLAAARRPRPRARARLASIYVSSSSSSLDLETIAAVGDGPKWFQIYFPSDRGYARELLQRAKDDEGERLTIRWGSFRTIRRRSANGRSLAHSHRSRDQPEGLQK
jgi:FMN-dependent dehydrogenase